MNRIQFKLVLVQPFAGRVRKNTGKKKYLVNLLRYIFYLIIVFGC